MIGNDLSALLRRWAEALAAAVAFGGALWLGGLGAWNGAPLGWALLALAAPLAIWLRIAIARARTPEAEDGPGVVALDERRLIYLGPLHGGALAIDAVRRVDVAEEPAGAAWRIERADGPPLMIPAGAKGAERLMEAFSALPGFDPVRAAAALASAARASDGVPRLRPVWRRDRADLSLP